MSTLGDLFLEFIEREKKPPLESNDFRFYQSLTFRLPMFLDENIERYIRKYNAEKPKERRLHKSDFIRLAISFFIEECDPETMDFGVVHKKLRGGWLNMHKV